MCLRATIKSDPLPDIFSLNPAVFASGLILANLFEENGEIISAAQSGAIFFNGPFSRSYDRSSPAKE